MGECQEVCTHLQLNLPCCRCHNLLKALVPRRTYSARYLCNTLPVSANDVRFSRKTGEGGLSWFLLVRQDNEKRGAASRKHETLFLERQGRVFAKGKLILPKMKLTHLTLIQKEAQRLTFLLREPTLVTRLEFSGKSTLSVWTWNSVCILSQSSRSVILREELKRSKAPCFCHLVVSFHLHLKETRQIALFWKDRWVCIEDAAGAVSVSQVRWVRSGWRLLNLYLETLCWKQCIQLSKSCGVYSLFFT